MRSFWIYLSVIAAAAILIGSLHGGSKRVPYAQFQQLAAQGMLTSVQIKDDTYVGRTAANAPSGGSQLVATGRVEGTEKALLTSLEQKGVPYTRNADGSLSRMLFWALPALGLGLVLKRGHRKSAVAKG